MSLPVGTGPNLDAVANLGIAATWNGAAQLATPGNIVLFGHRTTHGAPFRFIDSVPIGGVISLIGDDGHSYNYIAVRQDVTVPELRRHQQHRPAIRSGHRATGRLHAAGIGAVPCGHDGAPRQRHLRSSRSY